MAAISAVGASGAAASAAVVSLCSEQQHQVSRPRTAAAVVGAAFPRASFLQGCKLENNRMGTLFLEHGLLRLPNVLGSQLQVGRSRPFVYRVFTSSGGGHLYVRRLNVEASSSGVGAGSFSGDDRESKAPDQQAANDTKSGSVTEPSPMPSKLKGSLRAVGVVTAVLVVVAATAVITILNIEGKEALFSIISKSGFPAAFSLIFVSEIGDKTFFIAALLAMRHNKWLVLLGASGALSVMTVISVVIGRLFRKVPASLQTTLPIGEYAAVALLIWFGLRSIKAAWDIPSPPVGAHGETQEMGELAEAEEFLAKADDKRISGPLEVLGEAFTLIFVAEWGDRSMLATIALGAAQSPWGVASGAIGGHVVATLLAIIGGALLARYLSEKMIGYFGGVLFLLFAVATLAGVF